jgi:hypothetical protein
LGTLDALACAYGLPERASVLLMGLLITFELGSTPASGSTLAVFISEFGILPGSGVRRLRGFVEIFGCFSYSNFSHKNWLDFGVNF